MSGFVINLAALPAGQSRVEARAEPAELDLPQEEWSGPITAELRIDKSGDAVSVRGPVAARAHMSCVRCLEDFELPVAVDLTVFADRAGSSGGIEADLERDDYMTFHDGRQLDLRDEVREALLLELPMTPHCTEACRGLCPRCGGNLNLGPCRCATAPRE
jgi:uncharacterized protein